MRRARDSLGSEMNLTGHMTITTSNLHEVPLFLRLFREFGFDRLNFGYVKETVPLYLATHLEFAERLKEETSAAMREVNEGDVDALRLKLLGLWRDARIGEGSSSVVELPIVQMSPSFDQVVLAKNDGSSASQRVIGDPVLDVLREIDHDYRVVAFIRHSERSRTPSPADPSMDNVPLTPRGVELAHQFGGELPDFGHASVSHSSIIRAIQTATESMPVSGNLIRFQKWSS
jgi:hypothetical protein